jgi:hypothetical protein
VNTVTRLDELAPDELARLRETLGKRFRLGRRRNLREIGFGMAERGGRPDQQRPDAVCFHVREKCEPANSVDRFPAVVRVRLRRGSAYVQVCLKTDVIQIPKSGAELTGRTVRHLHDDPTATTGAVVAWRPSGEQRFRFGVLTVGHLVSHVRELPERRANIRVRVPPSRIHRDVRELGGVLLARTRRGDGSHLDAALVRVERSHLETAGWIDAEGGTPAIAVCPPTTLPAAIGRPGTALPRDTEVPFLVRRYFPVFKLIPSAGPLQQVLEVESGVAGSYAPGTSGTLWVIDDRPAVMQFGGWRDRGSRSLGYRRGLGQSLGPVLSWARDAAARQEGTASETLDTRIVRVM